MTYNIVWNKAAENRLADVWMNATDLDTVASATKEFDQAIQAEPLACGESRVDNMRIAFCNPLGFVFRVDEDRHVVTVTAVWRIR